MVHNSTIHTESFGQRHVTWHPKLRSRVSSWTDVYSQHHWHWNRQRPWQICAGVEGQIQGLELTFSVNTCENRSEKKHAWFFCPVLQFMTSMHLPSKAFRWTRIFPTPWSQTSRLFGTVWKPIKGSKDLYGLAISVGCLVACCLLFAFFVDCFSWFVCGCDSSLLNWCDSHSLGF